MRGSLDPDDAAAEEPESTSCTAFYAAVRRSGSNGREPLKKPVIRAGMTTGLYLGVQPPTAVSGPRVDPPLSDGIPAVVR